MRPRTSVRPLARAAVRRGKTRQVNPPLTARRSSVAAPDGYTADGVRAMRVGLGLSQSLFAHLLGVSTSLVEHWERGVRPPSLTVRRLFDAMQSHPDSFLCHITAD